MKGTKACVQVLLAFVKFRTFDPIVFRVNYSKLIHVLILQILMSAPVVVVVRCVLIPLVVLSVRAILVTNLTPMEQRVMVNKNLQLELYLLFAFILLFTAQSLLMAASPQCQQSLNSISTAKVTSQLLCSQSTGPLFSVFVTCFEWVACLRVRRVFSKNYEQILRNQEQIAFT